MRLSYARPRRCAMKVQTAQKPLKYEGDALRDSGCSVRKKRVALKSTSLLILVLGFSLGGCADEEDRLYNRGYPAYRSSRYEEEDQGRYDRPNYGEGSRCYEDEDEYEDPIGPE